MKGVDSIPIQNSRFMSLEEEDKGIIEYTHNQIQTSLCFSQWLERKDFEVKGISNYPKFLCPSLKLTKRTLTLPLHLRYFRCILYGSQCQDETIFHSLSIQHFEKWFNLPHTFFWKRWPFKNFNQFF